MGERALRFTKKSGKRMISKMSDFGLDKSGKML